MFIDYYKVLEADIAASPTEIKSSFKKQALKWHPDKNPGVNTNDQMRLIIEAHLILKDSEARKRYDVEYRKYYALINAQQENTSESKFKQTSHDKNTFNTNQSRDYTVTDDVLNKWMENAAKQATDYLAQTIEDFKGIASIGAKTLVNELMPRLIGGAVILIILAIFAKCCN